MVHTYDWRAQPDWAAITDAVEAVLSHNAGLRIHYVETGRDEHAIVIGTSDVTEGEASTYYQNHREWEDGKDGLSLDWKSLIVRINLARGVAVGWGIDGINTLNQLNTYLRTFQTGIRTVDFYDEIFAYIEKMYRTMVEE
jgi:hypothetical protein